MEEKKQNHDAGIVKNIKKLTLPDGFRVGIIDLDNILKLVADLNLIDTRTIKTKLLQKTKENNYVPSSAENEYSAALYKEYQRRFGVHEEGEDEKPEIHKHTPG